MSDQTIKLELSIQEVNLILEALGDQPFKAVFALVSRLQSQARSQLGEGTAAGAPASAIEANPLPEDASNSLPTP
ncbi:MAG: hypothetical protein ACK55X_06820 [Synechococcaceae cyanobacterium]|jgi:hypothetical protein